ncbi:MAG: hypothetical protein SGARI_004821, partial [Bacillariaceae sp.]
SFDKAWNDVKSLQRVLSSPLSSDPNVTNNEAYKQYISNMLTSIPQDVSNSFLSQEKLSEVLGECNASLAQQQDTLHERLDAFWNTKANGKHAKKRPRKESQSSSKGDGDQEKQNRLQKECIQHTEAFVQSHKEALAKKYSFIALPNRG